MTLDELPTVINAPGDYQTRDGRRVTIHTIDKECRSTFAAKGAIWRVFRGKYRPRGYDIWHISGRHGALQPHALDIVDHWEEVL